MMNLRSTNNFMKQLALTLLLLIACCATALAQTSNYLSAEYVGNSTVQSNITAGSATVTGNQTIGGTLGVTGVISGNGAALTNLQASAISPAGTSESVSIQTNAVGPHGYTLVFTNGVYYGHTTY
jgi:hypothetical protein